MTPIEELKKGLDELGVEYDTYDLPNGEHGLSWIDGNDIEWEVVQQGENFRIHALQLVTPEQAIAATVGTEPDEATMLKLHDRMNAALLDYESAMGIDGGNGANAVPFVNEMHQIIEDAAKVSAGTCHIEECEHEREIPYDLPDCDDGELWFTDVTYDCDECGYENTDQDIRFCGGCGRKVVDKEESE